MSEPSLLADIAGQVLPQRGPACSVAVILRTLAPDDAADLVTALAGSYTNKQIAAALHGRKFMVGHITIGRHRRRDCLCP